MAGIPRVVYRPVLLGRLGHTFLLFFGRGTGPKRSGTVLACLWTDCQAKPSILDPIRGVFDDLGPNRHFGRDLDLQDQARDWLGGPGPAHTFFPHKRKTGVFIFGGGSATPLAQQEKAGLVFIRRGSDPRSAFLAPKGTGWASSWSSTSQVLPTPGGRLSD